MVSRTSFVKRIVQLESSLTGILDFTNSIKIMKNNTFTAISALGILCLGAQLTSCSFVSQAVSSVRSIDLSQYPGLNVVASAQKGMMNTYSQSAMLILRSRMAALDALVLDAEAIAANEKAGDIYNMATKIAADGKEKQKLLQAQIKNITNSQDIDVINKAKDETASVDSMIAEGYSELSKATCKTNASIANTNKKGDMYIAQSMKHQAAAKAKIAESYSLLQDSQIMELKLAAVAAAQTTALVNGMSGASTLDKAILAVQFRPIIFFLTGLPEEFNQQNEVCAMWEEHAANSNIKLNTKKVGSISEIASKAAEELTGSVSLDSFGLF